MKKTAFLLFMIFALVQLAPAIRTVFSSDTISIFLTDEEKVAEKINTKEIKEKNDFAARNYFSAKISEKINTAFHLAEKIHPFPCLEKLTPPPNFC